MQPRRSCLISIHLCGGEHIQSKYTHRLSLDSPSDLQANRSSGPSIRDNRVAAHISRSVPYVTGRVPGNAAVTQVDSVVVHEGLVLRISGVEGGVFAHSHLRPTVKLFRA